MSSTARRRLVVAGVTAAIVGYIALRIAAVFTVAFNWDELALLDRIARSLHEGKLLSGGRPGLAELLLAPVVAGCEDETAVARAARLVWIPVTLLYLAGVGALLCQLLRGRAHRLHDAMLGVALLALLPAFLEWSIQVRTDQLALAGGVWGGVALLASARRPWLALAAGAAFGVGLLASQKLLYVAALAGLLALGQQLAARDWGMRRELARAGLALAGLCAVSLGFRALIALGSLDVSESVAERVVGAVVVQSGFDAFAFYRNTIGYSQYVALLPTLVPHLGLLALLWAAPCGLLRRRARRDVLEGDLLVQARFRWQSQHALGDDVAQDLVRAAGDSQARNAEELRLPGRVVRRELRIVESARHARELHAELRHVLEQDAAHELAEAGLRAGRLSLR